MKGKDKIMISAVNLEKKLLALERELHSILNMVREERLRELGEDVVEASSGAWGYDVDSAEFVRGLRGSKRLDWIE